MFDKTQITKVFMVLGVVLLIISIVMLTKRVVKSQETGKLIDPQTGKTYCYNPKQTGYILLALALGSIVAVFALFRN
jgi:hypothetical protein